MQKLTFTKANFEQARKILDKEDVKVFNFLNSYSVYLFRKEKVFRESVVGEGVFNFLDGGMPSLFLSLTRFQKINRLRGPTFTREFIESEKNSRIMFVGNCSGKDLDKISKEFEIPMKNLFCYSKLPFIAPKIQFSNKDIEELAKEIKSKKIKYCFVCVGNPRQEILSFELSKLIKSAKFLSVGAALDFLLGRKKEAPKWIQELYLEWFYRLATDFRYSWRKVWYSFVGLGYLVGRRGRLEVGG
jgi:exopolysaccharide biosynthesis WecB/TagA/CpsF family protein